jgi:fructose-1,6-bisphosphatase I
LDNIVDEIVMHLSEHIHDYPEDIKKTILKIAEVSKKISKGFVSRQGNSDTSNIYGEKQLAMDKWADELLIAELGKTGLVNKITSEEQPEIIEFQSPSDIGLTIDPLDGSSLIGINLTVGTIVGIHRGDVLKPGNEMIGAMYILYGPLTILVYSLRNGVHEFVLNDQSEYVLQKENITIPDGKIYSPGALRIEWFPYHKKWVEQLELVGYKLRYSGSFVADVHQILHKGGVFTYPAYKEREKGKLRLLFECVPMGYIIAQAGGAVSDGVRDILTIHPENINERIPVYIGGKKEIQLINQIKGEM